jgi:hypothetical protein
MASQARSDALEGADFEERRLKLEIKADALGGRSVAGGDVDALKRLAFAHPRREHMTVAELVAAFGRGEAWILTHVLQLAGNGRVVLAEDRVELIP